MPRRYRRRRAKDASRHSTYYGAAGRALDYLHVAYATIDFATPRLATAYIYPATGLASSIGAATLRKRALYFNTTSLAAGRAAPA